MPRISVVVPIFKVEEYLPDCLESLRQQTARDLEVIMVDDGSPDSSAAIAASVAERDPRFRLIRQENGGLGRARNAGVAQASGEFLAFVDSDDLVPRNAYQTMLDSLDGTGSDLATGNMHRLTSAGTRQSSMVAAAFSTGRPSTHVSAFPALLQDRTATNKLWRRSFWDRHGFAFPEGVLHEDIQVAVPSHVLARAVDVIREPVYLWRVREGEERSITQRRTEIKAITDRHRAVDAVSRFLADRGDNELKLLYDQACAAQDFRYSLQELDVADDAFRTLFLDLVNDFFDRAHPKVFAPLRAIDRLKYHLVRRRLMPELLEVLKFDKTGEANRIRSVRHRRRLYGDYPFRTDRRLAIPRDVYRLDQELRLRGRIDDVWWEGDRLWVEGFAYIAHIDLDDPGSSRLSATLRQRGGGGRAVELPVERVYRPDVTADARESVYRYDWSGFRTSVPASALEHGGRWRDERWQLRIEVRSAGVTRQRWLAVTTPGRAQRPDHHSISGGRLVPTTERGTFAVHVDTLPALVQACRCDGDVLELEGTLRDARAEPATAELRLTRQLGTAALSYPVALSPGPTGSSSFVARLPLADVVRALEVSDRASHAEGQGDGVGWDLAIVPRRGAEPVQLAAADDLPEPRRAVLGREVLLHRNRVGRLSLVERDFRPEVLAVRWSDEHRLELEGRFGEPTGQPYELVLRAKERAEEYAFPVRRAGERFHATLTPAGVTTLAGPLPLREEVWDVLARPAGATDRGSSRVVLDRALFPALPLEHTVGAKRFSVRDVDYDCVVLDAGPDLMPDERGAVNQQRLQTVEFPAFLRRPVRDAVLFESYGGTQYADSPRAIQEELARRETGLELLWGVSDGQTELPEGVRPVRRLGREWHEALARSRYVVTCVYRPLQHWLTTPDDQVVLQTWHGAPFKKIGFDSERIEALSGRDYHERLQREIARWDYLISPNPVASPILRSAFRFQGKLLETGYPRTDIFFRDDRAAVAERVRRQLGIPPGKTVVLYAPTFRDDQQYRRNQFRLDLRLDLARARAALAPDHVLLVRRHTKIIDAVLGADPDFVRDVSLYPDVNELLLATDVLVTDYSSLMFDFANTGRPMVFFTYDLDDYRDRLRGFYFDVERAPGPLLRTSDEVIAAVARAQEVRAEHDDKYAAFTRDFCAFDDGRASARVVDEVFGG